MTNATKHAATPAAKTIMQTDAWELLSAAAAQAIDMRSLFAADALRAEHFRAEACGILLDYSKNPIDTAIREGLLALADECQLPAQIEAMFNGAAINNTEDRAVLHVALRAAADAAPLNVGGLDVRNAVTEVRERCADFAARVRSGQWHGYSGQTITDVVNIGIGGSDLGPLMVCEALAPLADGPRVHFVSNLDGTHLSQTLRGLDAARTLFIIASKTFGTLETLTNARSAREWLIAQLGDESAVAKHFVAVSTNREKVEQFGIDPANMFGFWDWVGGRYSLWSAIGLPIMIALGPNRFDQLLAGAASMDTHFRTAPLAQNLPVLLGLISIWHINFLNRPSQLIAPYNRSLHRFAAWLQQLDMESLGKSVQRDGDPVAHATGAIVWGEPGINGQHAYFQLIHQGAHVIPVDFILALQQEGQIDSHRRALIANCLAQSAALMRGKDADTVRAELTTRGMPADQIDAAIPHRVFAGNRPSNTLLLQSLDARSLGALLALYEHKVFVQAAIWGINAFDQWGVELGKQLATDLEQRLAGQAGAQYDGSTEALIKLTRG